MNVRNYVMGATLIVCTLNRSTKDSETYHINVRKKEKIRNRYNQIPHLTQKVIKHKKTSHIKAPYEVSPFSAGEHTAVRTLFTDLEIIVLADIPYKTSTNRIM